MFGTAFGLDTAARAFHHDDSLDGRIKREVITVQRTDAAARRVVDVRETIDYPPCR